MCGIAGLWGTPTGQPRQAVERMLAAMHHRGPDGSGLTEYAGGAAGMVRLALVDLSDRGQQPIWSADRRTAILFNGEIYNFKQLRGALEAEGYRFETTTDTEVALALYLRDGPNFVEQLRGMFAIAVLDWRRGGLDAEPDLLLARDRFGIKPLYLREGARGLAFASEIRGLVSVESASLDERGLADYLRYGFVLGPATIVEGIRLLDPGTVELHRPGQAPRSRRFATLPAPSPEQWSPSEASERLAAVLEESVALHSFADAPVGAFLSGGVDSSAIVALMRPHVDKLRTYSLRFVDMPEVDESDDAAAFADQLDCQHTHVDVVDAEAPDLLSQAAGALDQPSVDGLNTWMVSRVAAREVTGVLSGLGGDEFFAGYPVVGRMVRSSLPARGLGWTARALYRGLPRGRLRSRGLALADRRSLLAIWAGPHRVFDDPEVEAFLDRRVSPRLEATLRALAPGSTSQGPVGLARALDTYIYMGNQLLRDSDAMSMAHSLELRVPFVDTEVADFSVRCPEGLLVGAGAHSAAPYAATGAKKVLIDALGSRLPDGIAHREKHGFVLPYPRWIKGPLRDLQAEVLGDSRLAASGALSSKALQAVVTRAGAGDDEAGYPELWSLLMLELWLRANPRITV